jgi:Baseplate J-like protein
MSNVDFTRWNRAGLPVFRYVDANGMTHLDDLRAGLAEAFQQWESLPPPPEPDEPAEFWMERLEKQYSLPRQDWAWETSRAFARALHIGTEYIDAYANESFLRTATQWEHVRRLAAMIGYAPKPAASAETWIVLNAKASAPVEAGFQIKHTPADGAPPVIFETLEKVVVDPALNGLRLEGWDRNNTPFSQIFETLKNGAGAFWSLSAGSALAAGDHALVIDDKSGSAVAVAVSELDAKQMTFSLTPQDKEWALKIQPAVADVRLLAAPGKSVAPRLNGPGMLALDEGHGFTKGDIAAWKDLSGTTRFALVLEADEQAIRLEAAAAEPIPLASQELFQARRMVRAQFGANKNQWRFAGGSANTAVMFAPAPKAGGVAVGLALSDPQNSDAPTGQPDLNGGFFKLKEGVADAASEVWFFDPASDLARKVQAPPGSSELRLAGGSLDLKSGDWVLLSDNGDVRAALVKSIDARKGGALVAFDRDVSARPVRAIRFAFRETIRPLGYDRDPDPVQSVELKLQKPEVLRLLKPGRPLVLESETSMPDALTATVTAVSQAAGSITVDASGSALSAFSRGALIIRANAVRAGHGESKPLKPLGSGNAELADQEFALAYDDISQVRDATLPGGMRAAMEITAEGQSYTQVPSLRDSSPSDPHFTVRVLDSGQLQIRFGSGLHGRRLPTGANNVTVRFRRGAGLTGNLAALSLDTIAVPHNAVESVAQPLRTSGGDDRETLEQVAVNAPARLVAMDRAVCLKDYERLAEGYAGIWHAVAFELINARRFRQTVRVVAVPAGGGALGSLAADLTAFLKSSGSPDTDVTLEDFVASAAEISVTLRVNSAEFDPQAVAEAANAALLQVLDLRLRRPGQVLYRSEITQVMERVAGVANSDVVLFPGNIEGSPNSWKQVNRGDDGGIWAIVPNDNQVIYAADPLLLRIKTEEANF